MTRPVTRDAVTPPGLAARGRRMWSQEVAAAAGKPFTPAESVLLEEACRIADRLDRLHGILNDPGEVWLRFKTNDDATRVTVSIDSVLAESRQQAVALKQLLGELRQSRSAKPTAARGNTGPASPEVKGGGGVVSLADRIKAKLAEAQG